MHYLAISGMRGYLPDNIAVCDSVKEAINYIISVYNLPPKGRIARELKKYWWAERNENHYDLWYWQIEPRDCPEPGVHEG